MDISLLRRRALRRDSTDAEALLWAQLRAKRFMRLKFRRQHPCGPYILDFYCPVRRLAVELDGGQHFEQASERYDLRRTAFLVRRGVRVIRFQNDFILRELDTVLEVILQATASLPSP
ncbi:MAG TPA: endonuclease domain-containing protein [Polyangia bacterium]